MFFFSYVMMVYNENKKSQLGCQLGSRYVSLKLREEDIILGNH